MIRICSTLLFVLFSYHTAVAACASGANYAGCAGPNGAATYNKNTGQSSTYNRNTGQTTHGNNYVAPGTQYHGAYGNSATKAVQPGCAYVNGRRVCN
jgi:hypothetical protein